MGRVKGNSRCGACGRKGHAATNPLCPESVAKAAAAKALRALARELEGEGAEAAGLVRACVAIVQRAALAAAEKVAS
jgi:hypothetical protein